MTEPEKAKLKRAKLKRDIYFIADHYGTQGQLNKTIEECTELKDAIIGYLIGQDSRAHIAEEIADVKVMLTQIEYLLHSEYEVEGMMRYKVDRQLKRIEAE